MNIPDTNLELIAISFFTLIFAFALLGYFIIKITWAYIEYGGLIMEDNKINNDLILKRTRSKRLKKYNHSFKK